MPGAIAMVAAGPGVRTPGFRRGVTAGAAVLSYGCRWSLGLGASTMRVFVAGSTGAIGRQLVLRLVSAGHEVQGMTRDASKRAMLDARGAVGVRGSRRHD